MKPVVLLLTALLWTASNQPFFEELQKSQLSFMCLNVNGVTSKWENDIYIKLFVKYDIVCLCELKTSYVFSFPGYKCVRNRIVPGEENRGGVAILFSTKLWKHVHCISTYKDQVWFKLMSTPGIKYGCIYIAPRDSSYFNQESYAYIAEQCAS